MRLVSGSTYELTVPISDSSPTLTQLEISAMYSDGFVSWSNKVTVLSAPVAVLALSAPAGFGINQTALATGGPLSLDNFNGVYASGGIVPPNGATIDVTSMPAPPPPLSDYIAVVGELQGATILSTSSVSVGAIPCTDIAFTDTYSPTLIYANEAVYCPSGSQLYKFYLDP